MSEVENNTVTPNTAGDEKLEKKECEQQQDTTNGSQEITNGDSFKPEDYKSLYDFTVKDIDGNEVRIFFITPFIQDFFFVLINDFEIFIF